MFWEILGLQEALKNYTVSGVCFVWYLSNEHVFPTWFVWSTIKRKIVQLVGLAIELRNPRGHIELDPVTSDFLGRGSSC